MTHVLAEMEKLKNPNSGLGQFCMHLGEQFARMPTDDFELAFYMPKRLHGIFGNRFRYVAHTPLHKLFPMRGSGYDVWHCTHQDSRYLPTNKHTRMLLTIHDLNFLEKYSGSNQRRKLKRLQQKVNRADAIAVISKFTESVVRKDLIVGNRPLRVIYNGNTLKPSSGAAPPAINTYGDYFFSIGIVSAKKNFHIALPLLQHFKNMHWIIAGNRETPYAKQLLAQARAMNVSDRLHLIGTVSDSDKFHWYNNCRAFLFPSLAEGFGLPIVEAMSLGKPVFLSTHASLPEVGGVEAFYWQDFDANHVVETVERGLAAFENDPQRREQSIAWAKQFSWEHAARAYLDLYRSLATT